MRDAKKLLTAARLRGGADRERAAGGGPDRPRRRHRQGRQGPAHQGRHRRRRKPRSVAARRSRRPPTTRAASRSSACGPARGRSPRRRPASRPAAASVPIRTIGAPNPPGRLHPGCPARRSGRRAGRRQHQRTAGASCQKAEDLMNQAAVRRRHRRVQRDPRQDAGADDDQHADRPRAPHEEGLRRRRWRSYKKVARGRPDQRARRRSKSA